MSYVPMKCSPVTSKCAYRIHGVATIAAGHCSSTQGSHSCRWLGAARGPMWASRHTTLDGWSTLMGRGPAGSNVGCCFWGVPSEEARRIERALPMPKVLCKFQVFHPMGHEVL